MYLLLASGCAGQVAELPTWIGFDEESDESVVLLAVMPGARVVLAAGKIERDGWRSQGTPRRAELSAKDGFVVAKVSPTQDEQAYAVVEVRPDACTGSSQEASSSYATAFWSMAAAPPVPSGTSSSEQPTTARCPAYAPAGEARLPVFRATAARVTYVGGLRLGVSRDPESAEPPAKISVTPTSPDDQEAARRFMAQRYPKVTARVIPRPLEMMRKH
jgi:hypothetical protein